MALTLVPVMVSVGVCTDPVMVSVGVVLTQSWSVWVIALVKECLCGTYTCPSHG